MKTTVVFKNRERKDLVLSVPSFICNYLCERDTIPARLICFFLNNKRSPIDCVICG